eukprot:CAMPEP_0170610518 /NCGR_PEP_ID=MMETSP0224-20130122/22703_1 /TAXON_ID=285029 /ORGANISM="Togula jolla, Strain CCCM 725" /LENGTH=85 /DNA_ID=CAMNT_0010935901 /DNA_START=1068 /DNA_END=1321 /DNA_ORIENTATION=-
MVVTSQAQGVVSVMVRSLLGLAPRHIRKATMRTGTALAKTSALEAQPRLFAEADSPFMRPVGPGEAKPRGRLSDVNVPRLSRNWL